MFAFAFLLERVARRFDSGLDGAGVRGIERDEIVVEHALEQADLGVAVGEDESAFAVAVELLEAERLVEGARCGEVSNGEADGEGSEIHFGFLREFDGHAHQARMSAGVLTCQILRNWTTSIA